MTFVPPYSQAYCFIPAFTVNPGVHRYKLMAPELSCSLSTSRCAFYKQCIYKQIWGSYGSTLDQWATESSGLTPASSDPQADSSEVYLHESSENSSRTEPQLPTIASTCSSPLDCLSLFSCCTLPGSPLLFFGITSHSKIPTQNPYFWLSF